MVGLAALCAAVPASAAQYSFDFSGQGRTASGTLTTTDTAFNSRGYTAVTITSITGMINGLAITGLNGFLGSDNLYYLTGPNFLDGSGLGFTATDGTQTSLYYQDSISSYRITTFHRRPRHGSGDGVILDRCRGSRACGLGSDASRLRRYRRGDAHQQADERQLRLNLQAGAGHAVGECGAPSGGGVQRSTTVAEEPSGERFNGGADSVNASGRRRATSPRRRISGTGTKVAAANARSNPTDARGPAIRLPAREPQRSRDMERADRWSFD